MCAVSRSVKSSIARASPTGRCDRCRRLLPKWQDPAGPGLPKWQVFAGSLPKWQVFVGSLPKWQDQLGCSPPRVLMMWRPNCWSERQ